MTGDHEELESDAPRRGRWSEAEIAHLRRWYGQKDDAFIARDLKRSTDAVHRMAREVFDEPRHDGPWTDADVARLKQYLGAVDLEMLGRMIGRSRESIDAILVDLTARLDDTPIEGDELVRFKRIYGTRTDEDLALVFGRRLEVVRDLAATLCLSKDKAFLRRASGGTVKTRMPRWSADELETLRELYPAHSNLDIAQQLGRSVKSVVSKAHNMGLKKDKARLQQMGRQNVRRRYDRGERS
ncbi:MAG: hypothetical protein AAF726_20315 [Planctomycetota bacterium]